MVPDLSSFAKFKLNQLIKERVGGIYMNDNNSFVDECIKLFNSENSMSKTEMIGEE